jgi:hypothetical protein
LRRSPEKLFSQPLIERLRVGEKERLAHATEYGTQMTGQFQPNLTMIGSRGLTSAI